MMQVIERRTRRNISPLSAERPASRAAFVSRPLSAEQRDKIARAIAIKTRRDALVRIRLTIAGVEAELSVVSITRAGQALAPLLTISPAKCGRFAPISPRLRSDADERDF